MKFEVTRMSGAGNIFSVIDNRRLKFNDDAISNLAKILCNKNDFNNYSAEGLLVLESGDKNHNFHSKYYNPDGSSGMLCGNGGRCIVQYAIKKMHAEKDRDQVVTFSMAGIDYKSITRHNSIVLFLPSPSLFKRDISLDLDGKRVVGDYIFNGTDHVVINIDQLNYNSIDKVPIKELGALVRYHDLFKPKGTNANFYSINENNEILLRTYERGVEDETGACGTGAVATAIIAVMNNSKLKYPATVIPTSKIPLQVDIEGEVNNIKSVTLEGPAETLDIYEVNIPETEIIELK